jgi:prepilin-type N-terminal cleavage/methylation domain-containing protein
MLFRFSTLHSEKQGFSMVEMVTVVSIIGIIAAIAIPSFSSMSTSSKDVLAANRQELLNTALNQMAMAGRFVSNSPQLTSASDEQQIVMTLQMRDPNLVGSPFVIPNYAPKSSSDPTTYRLRYTGQRFELLQPPQAGIGLKIEFDGSDMGPPRVFPSNFRPFGS